MSVFFFFNDTATTEIYTLSLHDALPISVAPHGLPAGSGSPAPAGSPGHWGSPSRGGRGGSRDRLRSSWRGVQGGGEKDRKSTRLNSRHAHISYAVFFLKKKKKKVIDTVR